MRDAVGNFIAALALLVSIFGAAWVAYHDTGRCRRLERYGNAVQSAQPGSLEQTTLQSVFDQLALPLALEVFAPPRKKLRRWAWVAISVGLVIETVWFLMVAVNQRGWLSWTVYGIGLAVLVTGILLRGTWRERRQQWMRGEMHRRLDSCRRPRSCLSALPASRDEREDEPDQRGEDPNNNEERRPAAPNGRSEPDHQEARHDQDNPETEPQVHRALLVAEFHTRNLRRGIAPPVPL